MPAASAPLLKPEARGHVGFLSIPHPPAASPADATSQLHLHLGLLFSQARVPPTAAIILHHLSWSCLLIGPDNFTPDSFPTIMASG